MPEATPNITKIPAPRVPLMDQRTGLISREWFRFFNNIYIITGGQSLGVVQISNGGTSGTTPEEARANLGAGTVNRVQGNGSVNGITLIGDVTNDGVLTLGGDLSNVDLSTQTTGALDMSTRATNVLPIVNGGTGLNSRLQIRTLTADSIVQENDGWLINNKTGASCVVVLPSPDTSRGRQLVIKNLQAQTVVSDSSNVVPIGSTTAGTAILPATVGAWATLVSDGTNWIIMQS